MIFGRRQTGVASRWTVLDPVDELLRVFDPEADGKGLASSATPDPVQHLKGIPGAIADGQNEDGRGDLI